MRILSPFIRSTLLLFALCYTGSSHASPPPINYEACLIPFEVGPPDSLFSSTFGPQNVYICTIDTIESPPNGERFIKLNVQRTLVGPTKKTLRLPYWRPAPMEVRFDGSSRLLTDAIWPDLSKADKQDLILCAVDSRNIAINVAQLSGPDDPLVEQAHWIIKLRDAATTAQLKDICKQILDARAGVCALHACGFAIADRIAPHDPDGAIPLILRRLETPDIISVFELKKHLDFLNAYFEKSRATPELRQKVVDEIVALLALLPDPAPRTPSHQNALDFENSLYTDALKLIATAVRPVDGELPLGISKMRGASLKGATTALRESKLPDLQPTLKTIEDWLHVAPSRGPSRLEMRRQ